MKSLYRCKQKQVFMRKNQESKKVLLIFADEEKEQAVITLCKRSFPLLLTYAKNLTEARILLQKESFDIVVFGDFISGLGRGYLLISEITSSSILVFTDRFLAVRAKLFGVTSVLSFDEISDKKLNERLQLVPIKECTEH